MQDSTFIDPLTIYSIYQSNMLQMKVQFCFLKQIPQKASELDSKLSTLFLVRQYKEWVLNISDSDPIMLSTNEGREFTIAQIKWEPVPERHNKNYIHIITKQQRNYVISGNQRDMELWYDGLRSLCLQLPPETETSKDFIAKLTAAKELCMQNISEPPEVPPPPTNFDYND